MVPLFCDSKRLDFLRLNVAQQVKQFSPILEIIEQEYPGRTKLLLMKYQTKKCRNL